MLDILTIVPVEQIPKETVSCPTDDLQKLYKTCIQLENVCLINQGVGLSATQVGIPYNLFIVRYKMPDLFRPGREQIYFRYFLDCHYEPAAEEKEKSIEGCLSLRHPDGRFRHFEVERYKQVKVIGRELQVKPLQIVDINMELGGLYSVIFQHEADHGNLILVSDIGKEIQIW